MTSPFHRYLTHPLDARLPVSVLLPQACLEGSDFPQRSNLFYRNWKVAKGLCKLATSPKMRQRLREHGLVELLERALDGDNTDGEMHRYSLILLWQLSDQAAHVAAQVA